MNTTTHRTHFEKLRPYQADFVANFVRPNAPRNQILLAPTGSGIVLTSLALINDLLKMGRARRVLVLVDRISLRDQFVHSARELDPSIPVLTVDGQMFRELVAQASVGSSPWPVDVVVVMLANLAAKKEIAASLTDVQWDLVVVDNIGSLGASRLGFVRAISQSGAARRLLLMSSNPYRDAPDFGISDLGIVDWYTELANTDYAIHLSRPDIRIRDYRRSDEEIVFLNNLLALSGHLSTSPEASLQRSVLLRAAASSPYAAEQSIRKLRNRLAHGEFLPVQGTLFEDDEIDIEQNLTDEVTVEAASVWSDRLSAWESLSKTIASLDQIRDDLKLAALLEIIADQIARTIPLRLGVFTNFAATAWYLQQQLASRGYEVFRFTGEVPHQERDLQIHRFLDVGGILLFSAVGITGIDLRLDTGVVYDLPASEMTYLQLISRFSLITNADPTRKTIYLLRDMSRSIPYESDRLDKYLRLDLHVA